MKSDMNHPWFEPVWRRVAVLAVCFGVAVWDLSNGEYVWALIFGGMGAYAAYIFFVAWNKNDSSNHDGDA